MLERIKKAIADYEKAANEHAAAAKKERAANEKESEAWNKVRILPGSLFERRENNPEEIEAAHKASEEAKKARQAEKRTRAVMWAASQKVADLAADELRSAMKENPEKFDFPVHYKKFEAAVESITGESGFYIDSRYSAYLHFSAGEYGKNSCFLADIKEGKIDFDCASIAKHERGKVYPTLEEIKKEARKAEKDAEKIRKLYDKAKADADKIRNSYASSMKYYLPSVKFNGIEDDYRLF